MSTNVGVDVCEIGLPNADTIPGWDRLGPPMGMPAGMTLPIELYIDISWPIS